MIPMIYQQLHYRGCRLHRLLFIIATFLFIHCCCFQNEQKLGGGGGGGGGITITSALIISASSSSRYQHQHQHQYQQQQQQQHELGRRSTPAIQHSQQEQQQRRTFLRTAFMMVASVLTSTTLAIGGGVPPAQAKYGEGTRMNMPSYIDYLIDKNTVATTAGALYTGVDPATVLRRIADASQRLTEIETLASQGKWTQIQSILTGPLGTFSSSLAQIGTLTTTPPNKTDKPKAKRVAQLITTIKGDLIAIGQAASKKNGAGCIAQTKLASDDIQTLLELAFD